MSVPAPAYRIVRFLAVGSDIGQPHGPRKDIVEIGRFRIRNVDGVPLGEDAPGGRCSTCSHGVFRSLTREDFINMACS